MQRQFGRMGMPTPLHLRSTAPALVQGRSNIGSSVVWGCCPVQHRDIGEDVLDLRAVHARGVHALTLWNADDRCSKAGCRRFRAQCLILLPKRLLLSDRLCIGYGERLRTSDPNDSDLG